MSLKRFDSLSLFCVVGPTATGKSEVADLLAEKLGSVVVSCDAMQIYRGMDIGTAKVPPLLRRRPLTMVDVASINVAYSVALFQKEARQIIDEWLSRGLAPVLCGGSGLYVKAVIDEMDYPEGQVGSASRSRWESYLAREGCEKLWEALYKLDPSSAAHIHPHNSKRVIRALEMAESGTSYAQQKSAFQELEPHYQTRLFGLTRRRDRLYEAIDLRVDQMLEAGFLDEVSRLMNEGLLCAPTASHAIGYKEMAAYLSGSLSFEDAVEIMKRRSRQLAKRQLSWFRRDPRIQWFDVDELTEQEIVARILAETKAEKRIVYE